MAKVKIRVSPLGDVKIEAEGFVGDTCAAATKSFQELFISASSKVDETKKPEYYESNPDQKQGQDLTF